VPFRRRGLQRSAALATFASAPAPLFVRSDCVNCLLKAYGVRRPARVNAGDRSRGAPNVPAIRRLRHQVFLPSRMWSRVSTVCGCTLPFHVDCFSRSGRLLWSCQIQPECVSNTLRSMRDLAVPGTPEIPDGFVTRELFGTSRSFREARWGFLLVRVLSWF
jgi:hypothetical protein